MPASSIGMTALFDIPRDSFAPATATETGESMRERFRGRSAGLITMPSLPISDTCVNSAAGVALASRS